MTNGEHSPKEWSEKGLLAEIRKLHQQGRSLAFILGAGASASSGIPTGGKLAYGWLQEWHQRECLEPDTDLQSWAREQLKNPAFITHQDAKPAYQDAASHYATIFERRFAGDYTSGYAALEDAMEDAAPSVGYSILAKILDETHHRVVVTTNFDNLVADAMAIHASRSPLIVGHEALAGFARPQLRRPLVAKIHRDLHLAPKNDREGVNTLGQGWGNSLSQLFQYSTPLVLGYGGNDGSLMGFLNDLPAGHIPGRLFWCYRDEPPAQNVLATIAKHSGVIVKISGFDEFMQELVKQVLPEFKLGQLVRDIDQLAKERKEKYREAIKKNPDSWWVVELAAQAETDMDKREAIYREGLKKFPQSAELAGNFANFLADQRHDYDEAERYYRKALELDPSHAAHTGNFANFLASQRHDYDKAEHYYRKALELGPNDPYALANFAHLRLLRRQGDDLAQLPAMLAQVITLAKGQASQILAEALFYGVLSQALGQHSPTPYLARLKRVLALGYPRGYWDFTPLFDAVLPDIDPAQAQHYRALGAAILDAAALPALGALPWWQAVPEADPFTLPEEDQPPSASGV
jgi:Tfp pilus assembly protein PilF